MRSDRPATIADPTAPTATLEWNYGAPTRTEVSGTHKPASRACRPWVAGLVSSHDHDRAWGVVCALLADRAEEEAAEASGTARSDDE
jgi:hypothetical protein